MKEKTPSIGRVKWRGSNPDGFPAVVTDPRERHPIGCRHSNKPTNTPLSLTHTHTHTDWDLQLRVMEPSRGSLLALVSRAQAPGPSPPDDVV